MPTHWTETLDDPFFDHDDTSRGDFSASEDYHQLPSSVGITQQALFIAIADRRHVGVGDLLSLGSSGDRPQMSRLEHQ
jgi:hypothetical protein